MNKKFYDNTYTVFGPVDHWIATMTFMSNLIILTKKDQSHCLAELQYIWPNRLANDCPAWALKSTSKITSILPTSPMISYCGKQILQRDRPNLQQFWNKGEYYHIDDTVTGGSASQKHKKLISRKS